MKRKQHDDLLMTAPEIAPLIAEILAIQGDLAAAQAEVDRLLDLRRAAADPLLRERTVDDAVPGLPVSAYWLARVMGLSQPTVSNMREVKR